MKDRIMRAFIEEVHARGMKFTMDDLARRLGISKRTLYTHFSSKVEILEAIIDQSVREMDDKAELIIKDNNLTLIEKIKGVISVLPSHYEFYDLRILEQMRQYYPQQWEIVNSSLIDDWDVIRVLLEEGIQNGEIVNKNVTLMMKLIIDATNSILDQRFYMQNNITVSEALSSIVDILLYGLIPCDKR